MAAVNPSSRQHKQDVVNEKEISVRLLDINTFVLFQMVCKFILSDGKLNYFLGEKKQHECIFNKWTVEKHGLCISLLFVDDCFSHIEYFSFCAFYSHYNLTCVDSYDIIVMKKSVLFMHTVQITSFLPLSPPWRFRTIHVLG
jgi:hypothetical protein